MESVKALDTYVIPLVLNRHPAKQLVILVKR